VTEHPQTRFGGVEVDAAEEEEVVLDSRLVNVSWRSLCAAVAVIGAVTMVAASASGSLAMPSSSGDGWRMIARGIDSGDQVAVASAAKRRTTQLAVRVRVIGEPKTAELHTVVTCSKAGYLGIGVFSRRDKFTVTAPALRVLRLPIAYPENCGVVVIGMSNISIRRPGKNGYVGRITVDILVRCFTQKNGACI
jgi:hypothetical protein